MADFKSGFVNIVGNPNVGKSTLMNVLTGTKISIITSKSQTTRHRILGIINGENFQIIYSDSPGIIHSPAYKLQKTMNDFVRTSLEDADVLLYVTDIFDEPGISENFIYKIKNQKAPKFLLINKIDLDKKNRLPELFEKWNALNIFDEVIPISALKETNTDDIILKIKGLLPSHPPYYPTDALTDKPEKFFVTEIIREQIFENYSKEIPYSCQVDVESFKENDENIKIGAIIYVERKSQKGIIIGKQGQAIKNVRLRAQRGCRDFFDKPIKLELFVKIRDNWRSNDRDLRDFGYLEH